VRGCLARLSGGALLLLVFGVLAWAFGRSQPTSQEIAEPAAAATEFADAWQAGRLDTLRYDPGGAPDVGGDDADRIAKNVTWMVSGLSEDDQDRPARVVPVGNPRIVRSPEDDLRPGDRLQPLEVTWNLAHDRTWTYRTEVALRTTGGDQRVLWRPSAVHPALVHGMVLKSRRVTPARAPVLDATDHLLSESLAPALVGQVAVATHELAEANPERVEEHDLSGTSGLQLEYDAQLAGRAGIEVDALRVLAYKPLGPAVRQVYVVPPVAGRPLRLTLDSDWQRRADAAVAGAETPTGVIALDSLTGRIIAAASGGGDGREVALQGSYPPGDVFRLVTTLALARAGQLDPADTWNCTPLRFEDQSFASPPGGPTEPAVTVDRALATSCRPGLARSARALHTGDLVSAAQALGVGVPSATGTRTFDGEVPEAATPLQQIQNALGEGAVLASPLSMARAAATVAAGTRRTPVLVLGPQPLPTPAAPEPALSGLEQALLGRFLEIAVRDDDQLVPLRALPTGPVAAFAGTAGYGPAADAPRHAWCVGYQGSTAFAVLVADVAPPDDKRNNRANPPAADPYLASRAVSVAAALLR